MIGPDTHLVDTIVGEGAVVRQTVAREAEIGDERHVRAVRPSAARAPASPPGAHIGNFVETKNAEIGEGAKVPHLSYVGDAEVGDGANIGAGTITANYDGKEKHRTKIGKGATHRVEHRARGAGRGRRRRLHGCGCGREPRRAAESRWPRACPPRSTRAGPRAARG